MRLERAPLGKALAAGLALVLCDGEVHGPHVLAKCTALGEALAAGLALELSLLLVDRFDMLLEGPPPPEGHFPHTSHL